MEISLESINEVEDPYQAFLDSIKNKETLRKYRNHLHRFLKLVPNEIYQNVLGKTPKNDSIETLSEFFVELGRNNAKIAQSIIAAYVKEARKKVEQNSISPTTFPTYIKPIRRLLDANGIAIHWKSLYRLYPRGTVAQDRAYTREELQKMIDVSTDLTDKVIITMFSSGGFRIGAWETFTWKDVIFFKNNDGSYKGAALLVYRGDPESYWTHLTPEACNYLSQYRELWKSQTGKYPKDDDPILKTTKVPFVKRLNTNGVKKRISRLAKKVGLRSNYQKNKVRFEVPLAHGFRKYFNTMLRRARVTYLDKEDMMGHSVGLERHYERYKEEDFERFPEYEKAIPYLTIQDTERVKFENQKLKDEKTLSEKNSEKLEDALLMIKKLQADLARMEALQINPSSKP